MFSAVEHALREATIIVNFPTHDNRMSDRNGVLSAKRSWLSQDVDGQARVYISASNWNVSKNQRAHSDALHTIYLSGQGLPHGHKLAPKPALNYEYRQREVEV